MLFLKMKVNVQIKNVFVSFFSANEITKYSHRLLIQYCRMFLNKVKYFLGDKILFKENNEK